MKQVKVTELARTRRKNNFAGLKEKKFASCGALLSWLVVFILFSCAALKIVATLQFYQELTLNSLGLLTGAVFAGSN